MTHAAFASFEDVRQRLTALPRPDPAAMAAAEARQAHLTKPAGALGRLEAIAIWLSAWQGRDRPRLERVRIAVFAGNHGIAARGVSAYPAEVTVQMVKNFEAGGAAINQLAKAAGADLTVVALDLGRPTADFCTGPAMTEEDCLEALNAGAAVVEAGLDLLAVGEMGIANTTVAATLAAALFGGSADVWVGAGSGVDQAGIARKAAVVRTALEVHGAALDDPLEALRRVGGRELAAMAGAILAAREARIPVLLDGFVSGAAGSVLHRAAAGALDHTLAAHLSAESGHARLLDALALAPLLRLSMRLGEASGAALAIPILRAAIACHNDMATFDEAGVSGRD